MESDLQKLRIDKAHKPKHHDRATWPWVLILVLLIGGGAAFYQWHTISAAPSVVTMRVRPIEGPATQADTVMLNATGYIIAAHKIELASRVDGRVSWIGIEMGDKISKGQVLVKIEDDEFRAHVLQQQGLLDNAKAKLAELQAGSRPQEIAAAQAQVDQAQAEYTNAQVDYQRLKDLESTKSVSQQQIDDAEALVRTRKAALENQQQQFELTRIGPRKEEIDAQQATVHQLEGSLANAQIDLDNCVIRSPVDATVLERNVEVGEFVTTGFVGEEGAKGYVASIADLNDLRVELDISQNDFAKIIPHGPCTIVTDAYPDKKYQGTVDLISPEANRQKATVLVRVKVLNPDDLLKPDMNATVSFLSPHPTTQSADATHPTIRIPSSSVRDGSVFVVENNKAVKRPVETTPLGTGNEFQIRSGLIGGEDLILNPPDSLQDGTRVHPNSKDNG